MPPGHDNFSAILVRAYLPEKNQDTNQNINTVRPFVAGGVP